MNPLLETGVVIAVIALAAAFVVLRIVKTFRSKRPSCCSGDGGGSRAMKKAACPHCAENSVANSAGE
jgi:hypothetical protein